MKEFVFDVMLNGRFICTLKYKYCALFPIDLEVRPQKETNFER